MPDSEPDGAGPEPGGVGPEPGGIGLRLRTDRRWQVAAVAGALALVLGGTVAVAAARDTATGGIADGPLLTAPATADHVPAGRIIEKLPRNCGVSDATAARLAPGADRDAERGGMFRRGGAGSCKWYSLDDGKVKCDWCMGDFANERVLDISITLAEGRMQSPISEAMEQLGRARPNETAPKLVEGLGEEATARYAADSDTEGAVVTFREGNAVARIRYRGWDDAGDQRKTISEKTAMDGAFAAAAETAKSLGTAANPVLATVVGQGTPPLSEVPKPCDTVPVATVDKVARDAYRRRGGSTLLSRTFQAGMSGDSCTWNARTSQYSNEGRSRTLTVSLAIGEERLPGMGVSTATRQYQGIHRDLREGKVPGIAEFTDFTPLAGPGDRAFAVTNSRTGSRGDVGLVVFQKRNVLIEVAYEGADHDAKLSGRPLIDSAYTVAVAVERSLRS
ncbi:hypothetical protein [Actinomadura sp. 7K507]|uniref:hypothetical protein n=1 Tax=Actinomadura sp. 7K507 TaxID=2530365 RepID=UPI001052C61D|nr:hypothetical protein [Actinomadura sp. 7K507]TDC95578.1 hypothetical protein E1285_06825 [Actinomadura sp. 7K507]